MTANEHISEEMLELIDALSRDVLDANGFARIEALATSDIGLRRLYLERMTLVADLDSMADDSPVGRALRAADTDDGDTFSSWAKGAELSPTAVHLGGASWKHRFTRRPKGTALVAASLFIAALIGTMAVVPAPQFAAAPVALDGESKITQQNYVAQLVHLVDAKWGRNSVEQGTGGTSQKHSVGTKYDAGDLLHLTSGLAQIKFADGAEVILQGPAQFEVQSAAQGRLERGQLTALAASRRSKGFAIETPNSVITDIGTEFGVLVDGTGRTAVEVFDGVVVLDGQDANGQPTSRQRINAGESFAVGDGGKVAPTASIASKVTRSAQLLGIYDPKVTLLGLYTFDGDANDASRRSRHATEVSNINFVEGYEGMAAQFAGTVESYIDLPIDVSVGAEPVITWGAWIRPTKLGERRREILSTDDGGYDRVLTLDRRDGRRFVGDHGFACMTGRGVFRSSVGPPEIDRWTFVAAIYDQRRRTVDLYVEDQRQMLVRDVTAQTDIGESLDFIRVGMHADGANEPFAGQIDNVFIFRGACNTRQLERIREYGSTGVLAVARGQSRGETSPRGGTVEEDPTTEETE